MKYIKEETEDFGLPNWRVEIKVVKGEIRCCIENFKTGFIDGEHWDEVYATDDFDGYVSIITKKYENIKKYKYEEKALEALYQVIKSSIKHQESEIEYHQKRVKFYKNVINSPIFRNKKIDKLLK